MAHLSPDETKYITADKKSYRESKQGNRNSPESPVLKRQTPRLCEVSSFVGEDSREAGEPSPRTERGEQGIKTLLIKSFVICKKLQNLCFLALGPQPSEN